jgi:hypothetical protein
MKRLNRTLAVGVVLSALTFAGSAGNRAHVRRTHDRPVQ